MRFRHRLALALHCTLAELSRRMTKREFLHWQVFDAMEPIGFLRDDYLAASIAQAAVMAHVKDPPTIAESILFAPDRFDESDEEESDEEHSVAAWVAAAERKGLPVERARQEDN